MLSFLNDPELKAKLLEEIGKHEKADAIIQGTYGEVRDGKWKGCAVGCALKSMNEINGTNERTDNHSRYETELGIPRILARLEDLLFDLMETEDSKKWPRRFIEAVPVGKDLSLVWPKFAAWLLADKEKGVIRFAKTDEQRKAIQDVADTYSRMIAGEKIDVNEWLEKRVAAYTAYADSVAYVAYADSVAYAAYSASYAAYSAYADSVAYAADSASYAAYSAYADSVAYAADSASYAAYSASYAATVAAAASSASVVAAVRRNALTGHVMACGDKLVEILSGIN